MARSRTTGRGLVAAAVLTAATVLSLPGAGDDARPALDELAWLAGTWTGERDGVHMEEHWTAPRGGIMLGLHRDAGPAGRAFFEYLRIESRPDGIFYMASPGGRSPATPFRLVRLEAGGGRPPTAVFENPDHDFPQRITYRREGDVLHARAESIDPDGGKPLEWSWQRRP